jgi:hypothetical protein
MAQETKTNSILNEGDLVKIVLMNLGKFFPNDVRAWRNNSGSTKVDNRFIVFGVPGQGDISGILKDGRRIEIECKFGKGRQSEQQKSFQKMIDNFNGIYILSYTWEDVFNRLNSEI